MGFFIFFDFLLLHANGMISKNMSQIYLVGGGIASLASAVYLIKDGKIAGKDIFIFDEAGRLGGSLDAEGSAKNGYMI